MRVAGRSGPPWRWLGPAGRARAFREDTRERRMAIARESERRFGRKVAWGVPVVGRHADEWLAELREAMSHVADVRARGPAA